MNKRFTKIVLPLLLGAASLPAAGVNPIFEFAFEDQAAFQNNFTVVNNNNDAAKWDWYSYTMGRQPYNYARVYNWEAKGHNDMMTTKAFYSLEAGHAYKIGYQAWHDDSSRTGSTLAIGYFSEENPADVVRVSSITPKYINKYVNEQGENYEQLFEVPASGNYGFVFMVIGDKNNPGGACIDNIVLTDAGSPMTPAAPVAVDVTGDLNFALKATVAVTLPSKTVTGSELPADGITKVEIYKADALVHTATSGLVPGEVYTWTDANASEGVNTYSVKIYNGELVSEATEGSAYVGPMTPEAPGAASAVKGADGKVEVSWTAPSKSVENQILRPEAISYKLWRVVDGEATLIADALTATTYNDTFSSETIVKVLYRVEAHYSGRASEPVETGELSFGAYGLPFEESFADGVLPAGWEVTSSGSGYYAKQWEVRSKMNSSPNATTFDGDEGMLTYNSFNASRGYWSQAITPEINIKGLPTPVVEFQFYHSTQNGSDVVELEISKDGGEFVTIPGSEIQRYVYGKSGWTLYQFPLAAYNDADAIRISFKATSAYGADMAIDAIRVYTAKAYDLEAAALEGAARVNAGEAAGFKFTVSNVAFAEVKGEDYDVDIYVNGNLFDTLAGLTLAPESSADFEFSVPTHAGHEENGITVYAEVRFDNDEDTSNNISQEITTGVETYTGTGVAEVRGELNGDTLRLVWDEIEVEDYEPMTSELTLDGEDYYISKEEYDKDKTIAIKSSYTDAEGRVWSSVDADGKKSDARYNLPATEKAFMYTSAEMTGNSAHKDYSGNNANGMLIAIAPVEGAASDYLVTPVMPGSGDHILEFMAKSYSIACSADFTVEYTTADEFSADDIADKFVAFGSKVSIPRNDNKQSGKWEAYSYHLPREAKYVAIHFVSKNDSHWEDDGWDNYEEVTDYAVLCLDNVKITSTPMEAPTYNVYYREYEDTSVELRAARDASPAGEIRRHNDETLTAGEYEVDLPGVSTDFHVSTVYPQGETSLSDAYRYNVSTGAMEVVAPEDATIRVAGNEISVLSAEGPAEFDVYALDGAVLASGTEKYSAAAGIYLIKSGKITAKVVVK